jgi:hypothetical protein
MVRIGSPSASDQVNAYSRFTKISATMSKSGQTPGSSMTGGNGNGSRTGLLAEADVGINNIADASKTSTAVRRMEPLFFHAGIRTVQGVWRGR